jgi:hypothetical protein
MQLTHVRVRGQRPNDRMLPTAATYHEYPHVSGAYIANPAAMGKRGRMGCATARSTPPGAIFGSVRHLVTVPVPFLAGGGFPRRRADPG